MSQIYDTKAPNKAVRLNINSDLLNIAKKQKINLSKNLEKLLIELIGEKIEQDREKAKKIKEVKAKLKEQKKRKIKERDEHILKERKRVEQEQIDSENDTKALVSKNIYSTEEKKLIMAKLNEERLLQQKIQKEELASSSGYTKEEKAKILKKLNAKRLSKQKQQQLRDSRTDHKEIYNFVGREFYKFEHIERGYFIELKDMDGLSERPTIVTLYYRVFEEMHKKDMLLKLDTRTDDKILISSDVIRVYFKAYALEDER